MAHRTRRLVTSSTLAAALLTLAATPCAAEWRRLDSPNFVIVGDVGAGTLRDIAIRFEGFRETLSRVLSDRVTSTAVPTIVIVFPSDKAFTPFKPKYQGKPIELAGLFLSRNDVNYIALTATGGEETMRVVFHEYAHLIIANVARNIPIWLNEGLAEYYSTYRVEAGGRAAVIGAAVPSHLILLNQATPMPLAELLAVTHESPMYNEGSRRSVFYAQSWALTHMLQLGQPSRTKELGQFLSLVGRGVGATAAWDHAFGAEPIEKDLIGYVRRRVFSAYRYTFPDKIAAFEATAAPLAAGDAEAFLADFLVQQGRHEEAATQLAKAAGDGSAWRATVGAEVDLAKLDYDAAQKRLLALHEGADWLTAYRAGTELTEVVAQRGEKPQPAAVEAARALLAAAQKGDRVIPNAAASLATLELSAGGPPPASTAAALDRARVLAPGRLDYAFLHARVLVEQSDYPQARNIVAPLMSPVYPQNVRDSARSLMGYIVRLEAAKKMNDEAQATRLVAAAGPPSVTTAPAAPDPSSVAEEPRPASAAEPAGAPHRVGRAFKVTQPDFRELRPGEQRLEGTLQRIDCRGAAAVFNVRTAEGPIQLISDRMDAVEFITYRGDLKGQVTCGPLPGPIHVYATWRPAKGGASRIAVAVEFLPQ
ncbi:MAG: DUF1570 domain-containing protein [Acidobacteriota bacterium]